MKINSETRLLLILGLIVLLGGGGMALLNRSNNTVPPLPTPPPLYWTPAKYTEVLNKARHVRGDAKDPRFTIIEFGDLQCPACRGAYNNYLLKVEKIYPIRFAFYHFPLQMHERAVPAAIATEAASIQGKFWPMFDTLYTGLDSHLSDADLDAAATKVGLDMKRFEADLKDSKVAANVWTDAGAGTDSHVSQTPTFLLRDEQNGQIYQVAGGGELDKKIASITHTQPILPPTPPAL